MGLWETTRSGSHAGRGFRFQDEVAAWLAVRAWSGDEPFRRLIPEGVEDISVELDDHWLHIQVKSRREHRGLFTAADLGSAWRSLATRLVADPSARGALVLERPLAGADGEGSLAETSSEGVRAAVRAALREAPIDAAAFLARTEVRVVADPSAAATTVLAERLGALPAVCAAHLGTLRREVGRLASQNGVRPAEDPAALSPGDVVRLIDNVSEAVDPSALEEAVRAGVCDAVDFVTPVRDERFLLGVDVIAGHVVAGQPLDRPELVAEVERGLAARGVALAVGPSGVGKSALIWMAAFQSRHAVRWYRVRQLRDADVPAVVRLAKGMEVSEEAPVGFVVDDLGREDRSGFDRLSEELAGLPGALLLGACREEDLILVRTARNAAQVRPVLDTRLAARIWQDLRETGGTAWEGWREPFERSEGLLLEYGHLLTAGLRMSETLRDQVERRVLEGRGLELEVLSLVAVADAYGGDIAASTLMAAVASDDADLKRALTRLIDEHLIADRGGRLGGLHELRSLHISQAIHRVPPPTLDDTVARVIELVDEHVLQRFVTRVLLTRAVADEVVIDALAQRLTASPDATVLAAALHALRLVSSSRETALWRAVLDDEGVPPTDIDVVTYFAQGGRDAEMFPERTQRAIERIRQLDSPDLRDALLARTTAGVAAALASPTDAQSVVVVLAALADADTPVEVSATSLVGVAADLPVDELRELLEVASLASATLAVELVDGLGGPEALLARLEDEQPWVRSPRLGVTAEGQPTAQAEYAYVAEDAQPDAHDAVVGLCRTLLALVPHAEVAVCRAIDATGQAAGFGDHVLADKATPRSALYTRAQVAWNRARARTAVNAVAASSETEYLLAACDLLKHAADVTRRVADAWARGRRLNAPVLAAAAELAERSDALRPPPVAIDAAGPLEEGELPGVERASFVGSMLASNLFPGLFETGKVAPLAAELLEKVDELDDDRLWRLIDAAPADALEALRATLGDLHAVLSEQARGDQSAAALRKAAKHGLTPAARLARHRAAARMDAVEQRLVTDVRKLGLPADVVRQSRAPDAFRWPSDDVLVLIHVPSIHVWLRRLEELVSVCRPLLADRNGFEIAPVRAGSVVAAAAVKVIQSVFPMPGLDDWPHLPLPRLTERLSEAYRRCVGGAGRASSVIASLHRDRLHDHEAAILEEAFAASDQALHDLDELARSTQDALVIEVAQIAEEFLDVVAQEARALSRGQPVERSLAASMIFGMAGDPDERFLADRWAGAACIEWDAEPHGAWQRVQAAMEDGG